MTSISNALSVVTPGEVLDAGPVLPDGAYHHVDYLAANTTVVSGLITSATDQGSVGGAFDSSAGATSPKSRYQPTARAINGNQFADFSDLEGSGFRDFTRSTVAAPSWGQGATDDDDFMVAAVWEKSSGQRMLLGTIPTVTSTSSGYFMRQESSGVLQCGLTPGGQNAWLGLASSSSLTDGWHVVLCEWGSGAYAYYMDNMASAFASGSYTWSGTGVAPGQALTHGINGGDGVVGIGGVVLYERKSADQAERELIRDALEAKLGL